MTGQKDPHFRKILANTTMQDLNCIKANELKKKNPNHISVIYITGTVKKSQ